jgi:hypothetical protein
MESFPNQRQLLVLCYVSKASITGDCRDAFRRDIMFLDFSSCSDGIGA